MVNCLKDSLRIEGHSVLLRLETGRVGLHHRKADGMPLNFAGPGGELVVAPEGFMGGQSSALVDKSLYYTKLSPMGNPSARGTLADMSNPLVPVRVRTPQRLSRSEVDRFSADMIRVIDTFACFLWEYINRNDSRLDDYIYNNDERIKRLERALKEQVNERLPYSGRVTTGRIRQGGDHSADFEGRKR